MGTRWRIGASFSMLAAMLFAAVAAMSGHVAREQATRESRHTLEQIARRVAVALEGDLGQRLREVQFLAQLPGLTGLDVDARSWRALLDRTQSALPHYTWIGVANDRGVVIAATGAMLEGESVTDRPWFVEGQKRAFVGDVHDAVLLARVLPVRPPDREPLRLVDVAAPLVTAGRTGGVLGAHLSWDWADGRRRETLGRDEAARGIEIVVLDGQGAVVLGPSTPSPPPELVASAAAGKDSNLPWGDGTHHLWSSARAPRHADSPTPGWLVVAHQPEASALAEARRLERQLWFLGAAGALLFGVAGWWLAGHLTQPLRALALRAQRAHATHNPAHRWVDGPSQAPQAGNAADALPDEVEQLAGTLRTLYDEAVRRGEALATLNETLEARVRDRTAALELANDDLRSFSRSVSHDLRGPIASIVHALRQMTEHPQSSLDTRTRQVLVQLTQESERLRQLVDDLLALAMVEHRPLGSDRVDLQAMVGSVLDELLRRADALERPLPSLVIDELPSVPGDAVLLRQVWTNLLGNALKYSARAPAPRVEVRVRRESDEWVFCVIDNGVGFDRTQAHRLFGVFQRLHRSSEFSGTGVGLSIVKRAVHRHRGRVWAESPPEGGARFHFTLPAEAPGSDTAAPPA